MAADDDDDDAVDALHRQVFTVILDKSCPNMASHPPYWRDPGGGLDVAGPLVVGVGEGFCFLNSPTHVRCVHEQLLFAEEDGFQEDEGDADHGQDKQVRCGGQVA